MLAPGDGEIIATDEGIERATAVVVHIGDKRESIAGRAGYRTNANLVRRWKVTRVAPGGPNVGQCDRFVRISSKSESVVAKASFVDDSAGKDASPAHF